MDQSGQPLCRKRGSMKVTINNLPSYPLSKYIVARNVDNALWYWGTWDSREEAEKVAREIDGVVIENED